MSLVTQNTLLIHEPSGEYPLTLDSFRKRYPNTCIGLEIDSEALVEFGFVPVEDTPHPEGDVVKEGKPEKVNGVWKRTWDVRSYSEVELSGQLENVKFDALQAIEQFREAQFAVGFPHLFGDGELYHVQVRDGDRANLLSKRTRAKEAIQDGKTDYKVVFQVYENIPVTLTAEEMVAMADAADDQVTAAYGIIWSLKEQVKNAKKVADIPVLPESIFK